MQPQKINIQQKFGLFNDYWNPRIVGRLNRQLVKLVKFKGEFVWHKHDDEDEMFLVVKGKFNMELRSETLIINEGDFIIIPRGTEHRPVAEEEAHVMLFEPESALNTGNVPGSELTRQVLEEI